MKVRCFPILVFLAVLLAVDAQNYVVEVLAVLDKSAKEKWLANAGTLENVRQEVRSVFVEINEIWKSLATYGLHVEVRLLNILLLNADIIPGNKVINGNQVDSDVALQEFHTWVTTQSISFDHAMFFTVHDLESNGNANVMGYAYIGDVCKQTGISVVEATTDYRAAMHGAHELGHSLGSKHDGDGNNCDPNQEFLMSPNKHPATKNKWFFSSCSANQIKARLQTLNPNCVNPQHTTVQAVAAPRLGELIDAEHQCKRLLGTYLSRLAYTTYGDNFCTQLSCHQKFENNMLYWLSIEMAEGTACGANKRCFHGKCVAVSNGIATMQDDCPYGDSPQVLGQSVSTCPQIASYHPNCSDKFWQEWCCKSC